MTGDAESTERIETTRVYLAGSGYVDVRYSLAAWESALSSPGPTIRLSNLRGTPIVIVKAHVTYVGRLPEAQRPQGETFLIEASLGGAEGAPSRSA